VFEMVVESLNISLPKKEVFYGKEITTGMCKRPVSGPLTLKKLGFDGDGVADTKNHGGVDKAVCVYSLDHYPYWEETLGIRLPAAAFGENLSVSNLAEDTVCIGDVFQLGTSTVQITQPRQPCNTLATRYGRNDLVKLVVTSGFTGFYLRVLQEGEVKVRDPLVLVQKDPNQTSVAFANNIFHYDRKNREGIDRVLAIPALSEAWQRSLQRLRARCT
jgi:MOSC domain-containing protein YiiM